MQLSKLQKHALRTVKNRQKLKYLSLGIIPSTTQLTVEKTTQKLINLDCCIHIRNNSDVLLTEFSNQLPEEGVLKKLNRFYAVFLRKVSQKMEQQNEQQSGKKQKEQNNAKNSGNKKGYEIQQLIDNIEKLTKLDDLIQKRRASNDKKFISMLANCMSRIYEEADKAQEIKKYKIGKLQKQIQKLYVESHDQYLKLMEVKAIIDQTTKIIVVNQDQQQITDQEAKEEVKEQKQNSQQSKRDDLDKQEGREKQDTIRQNRDDLLVKRKRTKSKIERIPADQKLLKEYENINQKILAIKNIIENREEEERRLSQRQRNIEMEKIQFLKLMLRNGYYQSDGIWWILAKLAKNNQKIGISDLNNILDITTKKHVISEYEVLKKQLNSQKQSVLPKIKQLPKQKQKQVKSQYHSLHNITYSKLINIPSQQNSMNIYRQAKSYIVDWVRQERWKVRSLKHKPMENTSYIGHEWKQQQIQRLRTCYPKQLYEKMLIYLFGSRKPLKMSHSFMFYLKQNRRKQSTAILNTTPSSQSALRSVDHLTRNNTNK